jgi:uncharacterized protein YidB (DUF937 family)
VGLLDTIVNESPQEHAAAPKTGIAAALERLLRNNQGGTGLMAIAEKLDTAGLGEAFQSWINPGANKPVAAQDLHQALGEDQVQSLAEQSGMSKDELLPLLAQYLALKLPGDLS